MASIVTDCSDFGAGAGGTDVAAGVTGTEGEVTAGATDAAGAVVVVVSRDKLVGRPASSENLTLAALRAAASCAAYAARDGSDAAERSATCEAAR